MAIAEAKSTIATAVISGVNSKVTPVLSIEDGGVHFAGLGVGVTVGVAVDCGETGVPKFIG